MQNFGFLVSFTQIRRFSSVITFFEVACFLSLTVSSFLYHRPRRRIVAELLDNLPPLSPLVLFGVLESGQVLVPPVDLEGTVRVLHDRVQAPPLCVGEQLGPGGTPWSPLVPCNLVPWRDPLEGLEEPPELFVQPRLVQLQGDNVGLSLQAPVVLLVGAALSRGR